MIASIPAGFRPKYAVNACMLGVGAVYGNGIAIVNIQKDGTLTISWIVEHRNEGAWRWVIGKVLYSKLDTSYRPQISVMFVASPAVNTRL